MTAKRTALFLQDSGTGVELVIAGDVMADFPAHTHVSTVILLLVRKGVVHVKTATGDQAIGPGGTTVIQPHTLHRIHADCPYQMICLCLDTALFTPTLSVACRGAVDGFLREASERKLLRVAERKILNRLFRGCEVQLADRSDSLARLRQRLETVPEIPLTLDDMAAGAHVDKGHLIRTFKKRYGLTPHGFLVQNRVRKARREFMGCRPLTEVALMAGFYDQSHFIHHFKRLYRMSPRDFLLACSDQLA